MAVLSVQEKLMVRGRIHFTAGRPEEYRALQRRDHRRRIHLPHPRLAHGDQGQATDSDLDHNLPIEVGRSRLGRRAFHLVRHPRFVMARCATDFVDRPHPCLWCAPQLGRSG